MTKRKRSVITHTAMPELMPFCRTKELSLLPGYEVDQQTWIAIPIIRSRLTTIVDALQSDQIKVILTSTTFSNG